MKNVGISLKKIEKKCNPTFLKNVATFCKMLTKIVDEINIFNVDKKMLEHFWKMMKEAKWNVD
jgi:hypothetical protein